MPKSRRVPHEGHRRTSAATATASEHTPFLCLTQRDSLLCISYRTLSPEEKATRSTTTVTLLVNPALRARLEEVAELNERSLGGQVRAILREYFEEGEEA